ncbi:hypothetical protein ACFLXP_04425 [Chloroflexota bacterium]
MDTENEKVVACWDFYDSQINIILEEGRMIGGNPQPVIGEKVTGVGDWGQAEVVKFLLKTVEGTVPKYDVYVKRLI